MTHPIRPDPERVFAALRALREELPPEDPTSTGCTVAIVALIAMVFMPFVVRLTPLSSGWLFAIGAGLGLVALAGALIGVFGGTSLRGALAKSAVEAADVLVDGYPDGDPEALVAAAVLILDRSTTSAGPSTIPTFERVEMGMRLGPALPFVIEVERILLERDEIYPCFTLD